MTADELFLAMQAAMEQTRAVMDEAAAALRAAHLANDALRAEMAMLSKENKRLSELVRMTHLRWRVGGAA